MSTLLLSSLWLQSAEQQESQSNFTKYCSCHAKWLWWLIRVTYETSFTMRRATNVIRQVHQILRLPRKMNLMIDPHLTWNIIYGARSNRNHNPTWWNTAPATQNASHDWSASHMKRHLECAEQAKSTSNLTKYCACHAKWISWLIRVTYATSFRSCAEQAKSTSNLSKYCACHATWIPWWIRVTHETSLTMRGACTVSHQPHQILRLPRNL